SAARIKRGAQLKGGDGLSAAGDVQTSEVGSAPKKVPEVGSVRREAAISLNVDRQLCSRDSPILACPDQFHSSPAHDLRWRTQSGQKIAVLSTSAIFRWSSCTLFAVTMPPGADEGHRASAMNS